MDSRLIIKKLRRGGWVQQETKATSHRHFKHPTKKGRVTGPHPVRDMLIGTIKSIESQSGVKLR